MSRKANFNVQRFYGHDNRGSDNIRRVSFQNNQGRIGKNKSRWNNVRNHLGWQEDVDMHGEPVRRPQGMPWAGNRKHRGGRGGHRGGPPPMKRAHWYQIRIVCGARYTSEVILEKLAQKVAPEKFYPVCYQVLGDGDSIFYVEKFPTAQLLLGCTRKINLDDGSLMVIKIKEGRPPNFPIDDAFREKMKLAMVKRYVPANKALDLSRFARDPAFLNAMFCNLGRPVVLSAALKIIKENIPDLVALNLSGNYITDFDLTSTELKSLKSLRILYISENNISTMSTLNCFKDLEITELLIEKNPVCSQYSQRSHFVRYATRGVTEIRKRFPKLAKLDNVELAPVVAFDVGDDIKFPPPQAAFVCHGDGRGFVKAFLSQYFEIYDSGNRLNLAQAYQEDATFSMSIPNSNTPGPRLNAYMSESRNLLRIQDFPRRKSKLLKGRTVITEHLNKLPKTQHDLLSFVVDLPFFSPDLICLSVCGIFRETGSGSPSNWPMRYFSRTFLIVPVGSGFCIVNEVLFVTNATEDQMQGAFKTEPVIPSPAAPSVATSPAVPVVTPNEVEKLALVKLVSEQTGMNLEWSKKCLEETNWDLARAAWTFGELQKHGVIPAEAFVK